jgi:hypothetical protein
VAAQHCDLVAQDEQLGVLGRLPASEQREPAKELARDQVKESECHGWRSSPASSAAVELHVNVMDEVSGTHRGQVRLPFPLRGRSECGSAGVRLVA